MFAFVIVAIVVGILACVGIPYVWGTAKQDSGYSVDNKRDYVVAHLDTFKVNNEGSSLDEKEIYLVSHDRLGV